MVMIIFLHFSGLRARELNIYSYNVENLFDSLHDRQDEIDKNDWTYLPKLNHFKKNKCKKLRFKKYKKECLRLDWNAHKVQLKINQITKVLTSDAQFLPHMLALVEIENENVVKLLAKKLGLSSYEVTRSNDRRGIDVALLYNESKFFKKIGTRFHRVNDGYFKKYPTRDILEVSFRLKSGAKLFVLVNHWPSLNSVGASQFKVAQVLQKRVIEILQQDKLNTILALGDFNTIHSLKPHPFRDALFKNTFLKDIDTSFREKFQIADHLKKQLAEGTYFYIREKVWNVLDRFIVSANLLDGKNEDVILESYSIYAPAFIRKDFHYKRKTKTIRIPLRYNFSSTESSQAGFSDHFPIRIKLKL